MREERCIRCGNVSKGYKMYIRGDEWVCRECAKDVEVHG